MIDSRYGVGETIGETIGEIHINMQYDIGAHDPKGLREKKNTAVYAILVGGISSLSSPKEFPVPSFTDNNTCGVSTKTSSSSISSTRVKFRIIAVLEAHIWR